MREWTWWINPSVDFLRLRHVWAAAEDVPAVQRHAGRNPVSLRVSGQRMHEAAEYTPQTHQSHLRYVRTHTHSMLMGFKRTHFHLADCRFYIVIETSGSDPTHDEEKLHNFLEAAMTSSMVVEGTVATEDSKIKVLLALNQLTLCSPNGKSKDFFPYYIYYEQTWNVMLMTWLFKPDSIWWFPVSGSVVVAWTHHRGADTRRLHLQVRHLPSCGAAVPAGDGHEGASAGPCQERGGIRACG